MREAKKHFLEILQIEMEDLKEDLDCLIQKSLEDRMHAKITDRVYMENVTLFQNELLGIQEFKEVVMEIRPDEFGTLELMIERIRENFGEIARVNDFAAAITICIDRKINKVLRYVSQ